MSDDDNAAWFKRNYGVPAEIGQRIIFDGQPGQIIDHAGPYLVIELDKGHASRHHVLTVHPAWRMEYIP